MIYQDSGLDWRQKKALIEEDGLRSEVQQLGSWCTDLEERQLG